MTTECYSWTPSQTPLVVRPMKLCGFDAGVAGLGLKSIAFDGTSLSLILTE